MRLKRTMSVLFFCTIFMLTSITVFAATKSRSSTYSIYHGVYSTNMSMKDKVIVKLTPSQCSKSNLGLYLEKNISGDGEVLELVLIQKMFHPSIILLQLWAGVFRQEHIEFILETGMV